MDNKGESNIIIYNTIDGKASVVLYAHDGSVWMNQNQLAELFDTSKQTISYHIINILKESELDVNSVVKDYLTTASDGKKYEVTFYSLDMIMTRRTKPRRCSLPRRRTSCCMPSQDKRQQRSSWGVLTRQSRNLTLRYWRETVDGLLNFQGKLVLQGAGSISNRAMEEHVDAIYEAFNARRKALAAAEAEQTEMELLAIEEKIEGREK